MNSGIVQWPGVSILVVMDQFPEGAGHEHDGDALIEFQSLL